MSVLADHLLSTENPFWVSGDKPVAPHLPAWSSERTALFREFRKTFVEDWAEAELEVLMERRAKFGDLYFVGAGSAIKIGRTTNIAARLRSIQAHNHEPIECLAHLKGQGWRESSYHKLFRAHRLRGEWFRRVPEIEAEIKRLNAPTPFGHIERN